MDPRYYSAPTRFPNHVDIQFATMRLDMNEKLSGKIVFDTSFPIQEGDE